MLANESEYLEVVNRIDALVQKPSSGSDAEFFSLVQQAEEYETLYHPSERPQRGYERNRQTVETHDSLAQELGMSFFFKGFFR